MAQLLEQRRFALIGCARLTTFCFLWLWLLSHIFPLLILESFNETNQRHGSLPFAFFWLWFSCSNCSSPDLNLESDQRQGKLPCHLWNAFFGCRPHIDLAVSDSQQKNVSRNIRILLRGISTLSPLISFMPHTFGLAHLALSKFNPFCRHPRPHSHFFTPRVKFYPRLNWT